ncbi:MAG: hypothetical protein ACD_45C00554G0003 [uncultured bacterium]|nr:MAG: hypothetical protein ACD_45C00554G0003 [uncultured bacterium]OGT55416.1 MAG: hypothetical protein A3F43_03750 [Gammaproteobacteria bacterium RIFCSPHIGHO2_12_FULL_42_10]
MTTLQALAETVGQALKRLNFKLVTAESCTGGGLSYWITSVPGSSDWFERGYVTYSNEAKIECLGVQTKTISTYGAVDQITAQKMAEGALAHSLADVSIAITGIAGPTGGTSSKPVGMVWAAYAIKNTPTLTQKYLLKGDRQHIREAVIERVLIDLLEILHCYPDTNTHFE